MGTGMVLFNVINPDMRHPFQAEFESGFSTGTPVEKLTPYSTEETVFLGKVQTPASNRLALSRRCVP